jgi:hypothetical protein
VVTILEMLLPLSATLLQEVSQFTPTFHENHNNILTLHLKLPLYLCTSLQVDLVLSDLVDSSSVGPDIADSDSFFKAASELSAKLTWFPAFAQASPP